MRVAGSCRRPGRESAESYPVSDGSGDTRSAGDGAFGEWKDGDGGARYPAYMSRGLWTVGIEPMEKIKKEHDIDMHKKWFSPNSPPE